MSTEQYKFDVAFSFLAEDEPLATQLNDRLQGRVNTFLYSQKQREIAGTDGEKTFSEVFGKQARIVVVLYRNGWGQTPWTRIEETAIRGRAYEHGYDFVIFVPLDDSPTVPSWLPRTRIWVGLKRWGIEGAASVVEARIQELGGEPHEETVQEHALRLQRAFELKNEREKFLRSEAGVAAARREFVFLREELQRLVQDIRKSAHLVTLHLKHTSEQTVILGFGFGLKIEWCCHWANSLENAQLCLALYEGHPPMPGAMLFEEPRQLQSMYFTFDLVGIDQRCWVSGNFEKRAYATSDLASYLLKMIMEKGEIFKRQE